MSTGTSKTRTQRLASIANVPTRLHLAMARLRQKSSIFCCLIFLAAFTALVLLLGIWNPPFPYYEGMAINRDIVARVAFETIDSAETEKERILAANRVPYVYVRSENTEILDENISKIYRILKEASQADAFDKLSPELQQQFMVPEDSEDSGVETGTRNIWRFLRKNPVQDTNTKQNATSLSASGAVADNTGAPSGTPSEKAGKEGADLPSGEAVAVEQTAVNASNAESAPESGAHDVQETKETEGVHLAAPSSGKGENQTVEPPKELEKALVSERFKEKDGDSVKSEKTSGAAPGNEPKTDLKDNSETNLLQDSNLPPAVKPEKTSKIKNAVEIIIEKTPVLTENSAGNPSDRSQKIRYSAKPAMSSENSSSENSPQTDADSPAQNQESGSSIGAEGAGSATPLTEGAEREKNDPVSSKLSGEKNENTAENSTVMLEKSLTDFCDVLKETIRPFFLKGLMHIADVKEDPLGRGLQVQIAILSPQNPEKEEERVPLKSVILEDNSLMRDAIRSVAGNSDIGDQIYYCICRNWKSNLLLDPTLTNQAIQNARQSVEPVQKQYQISQRIVQMPVENDALVGTYLTADMIKLLSIENTRWLESRTWEQKLTRGVAVALILLLCLILLWAYIAMEEPRIFHEYRRLIFILGFSILALAVAVRCARVHGLPHSMNLFPLILYGQILTIQYQRRIGILFGGMHLLCLYVTLGMSQMEMVCDFGILLTAILPLDRVRGRMQFVRISLLAAVVAFILFGASDLLMGIPFHLDIFNKVFLNCLPFLLAGLVIQSILPILERWLGILSDVRLLELCDVSNPLLNELVNRAPSTYSHSIALGTIGENAADAIHANGLLVRTAAYYHDIGKIFKPGYYAENIIEKGASPHLSLKPTASALIIIAHVKNGVALARQYHLPQQIIDLIEQHHGSTLVAYFFNQAKNLRALNPSIPDVEESSFRYPCPKPQTKEAVVLMLADACESACRSLVEPTPARIQGLVRKLAQERLEDEQFDESGITLCELRIVEDCIIKGLISYHHGRIKYPERIREEKTSRKPIPNAVP